MDRTNIIVRFPKVRGKSSSQEILGHQNAQAKLERRWSDHLQRMLSLRDQLLQGRCSQSENAKEELSLFSEHMAESATDSYDRDCALALLSSTQNALYEIELAIKRIHDGSYGRCEVTGEFIEAERLLAIPWTRFCIAAQAQLESRGTAGRIRLGKLRALRESADSQELDESESDEPLKEREAA